MSHTPEPWAATPAWTIDGSDGDPVAYVATEGRAESEAAANERRIVACVNACAGMSDPSRIIVNALAVCRMLARANNYGAETDGTMEWDHIDECIAEAAKVLRAFGEDPDALGSWGQW